MIGLHQSGEREQMIPYFYEKEADAVNYIYFERQSVEADDVYHMLPHCHDSVEFVFMLKGRCLIHIGEEQRTVQAGDMTFARCFEPHYYNPEAGAQYYVVLLSAAYLGKFDAFRNEAFPSFMRQGEHFGEIVRFLDYAFALRPFANESLKSGFADVLLGLMKLYCPTEPVRNQKKTQAFVEILKYLNCHFEENITLEELADRFGYTKTYFSEMFNKFAGMNLHEYVNRIRINEFYRRRREAPDCPTCRLAQEIGFNSLNTFYRVLRKYPQDPNF